MSEKSAAVQATHATYAGEVKQLREMSARLRDELETSRADKENAVQKERLRSADEIAQLHATVQSMREVMDQLKS